MAIELDRYRFTVDEYHRLGEAGILGEDDRVELIEGEIIKMSPIGTQHGACLKRLITLVTEALGRAVVVGAQDPILLEDSEPQPDLTLLKPRADFYESVHPQPADVLLVVEISDTTLRYDRQVKSRLYATAGMPEYWLVDLAKRTIELRTQPSGERYQVVRKVRRGESLTAESVPGLTLQVDDIVGQS